MTDTATPEVDTRQFTPAEIAIAVAKRVARVGDFDENWSRAIVERGIELAEDGAFTITTEGGQTFHLAVTQVPSLAPVYATTTAAPDLKRQVLATHPACDLGHPEARHPSYLLHIPDCYDAVWQCGDEVTVDPAADPNAGVLNTQYHQQQHAEAYRELVKLREQRDAALALIDGYDGAGELALLAKISNALGGAR